MFDADHEVVSAIYSAIWHALRIPSIGSRNTDKVLSYHAINTPYTDNPYIHTPYICRVREYIVHLVRLLKLTIINQQSSAYPYNNLLYYPAL